MELLSAREEELSKEGWSRMFTVEVQRVQEYEDLYQELGMEVLLETPTAVDLDPLCAGCYETLKDSYRTIYTRPKKK